MLRTEAFKQVHTTVAVFVDFEGAFDAVWRSGEELKLQKAGLCGNMLLYLDSFLQDHSSISIMNGFISE